MQHIEVRTRSRQEFVDITVPVEAAVERSAVKEGICVLWSTHTTAGLTVNENADPDVVRDMTTWFTQHIPRDPAYRHLEGNSAAHIKAILVGASETVLVRQGRLFLGTWQGLFLCEFDGPRRRQVHVGPAACA